MNEPDQQSDSSAWTALQRDLDRGGSQAFRQIFDEYSHRLIELAGRNIHPALIKRFDGEDVVQSVFRTFFRRHEQGQIQIQHTRELWQLLVAITICKTRTFARRHTAQRRDARTESSIAVDLLTGNLAVDRNDVVALQEEIDHVLNGLPAEVSAILSGRMEGRTHTEIANDLNVSRQTVHRLMKLLKARLQERFEQLSDDLTK